MNVNKINVLVVTYNQENVIGRCLESILCQKVFGLNKIIICDDHSTDNNWLIINAYKEKEKGFDVANAAIVEIETIDDKARIRKALKSDGAILEDLLDEA